MHQIKSNIRFLVLVSILFLISCNQAANTSDKSDKDTPQTAAVITPMSEYNPQMDSYISGGDAVKKLGDTLGIKLYEFIAEPGVTFPLHSHPDHIAYVLQGGTVALFIKEMGKTDTISFPTGFGLINGPLSDSGTNVGKTTIKMLVADIYRPRGK